MKRSLLILLLIIVPLFIYFLSFSIIHGYYSNDPEYAYLLNSINVAYFQKIGHTDHPGTPLQVLGGVILRIYHFLDLTAKTDLRISVLSDPEHYVMVIINVLQIMNVLITFLAGFVLYRLSKKIWLGMIGQTSILLSWVSIEVVCTKFTPEALLIFNSLMLAILLYYYSYSKNKEHRRFTILFAVISGFGIAIKVTAIPLIIIPLIILKGIKRKLLYLIYSLAAFIFFTLPIISQYKGFYRWLKGLVIHTGIYGQGEKGIINITSYKKELWSLITYNSTFSWTIVLSIFFIIACIIFRRSRKVIYSDNNFIILISLAITQIAGLLMVAKHAQNHYLTPFLCLTAVNMVFLILCLNKVLSLRKGYYYALYAGFTLFIIFRIYILLPIYKEAYYGYNTTRSDYYAVSEFMSKYKDYTKIYYIPYALNRFSALNFGNVYSCNKNLNALKAIYPNTYFYDYRHNSFHNWDGPESKTNIYELARYKKLLLINSNMDESTIANLQNIGIEVKNVYRSRSQDLNELLISEESINKFGDKRNFFQDIKFYESIIRSDSVWMNEESRKAKVLKISVDQVINNDAKCMREQDSIRSL